MVVPGKNDVAYTISATDVSGPAIESAIAGTKKVTASVSDMESKMKAQVASLQKHWMGISAAVYAAYEMISKAWNMAEAAAGYNEQMQMLNGLAQQYGTTADIITEKVQEIGDGMISMATSAEVSMKALAKQMTPDQIYQMAEAAVVLKEQMGTTANEAFKQLADALTVGKEKTLKMAVGVIDLKDRFGEQVDKMTEAEKVAKMLELVMERVRDVQSRTAVSTESVADQMEKFSVSVQNLQLQAGQLAIRGLALLQAAFQSLAGTALYVVGGLYNMKASFASLMGDTEKETAARATANSMWDKAAGYYAKSEQSIKIMTASTAELQVAQIKELTAAEKHKISEGERQKVIAETVKALDVLSKVIQKYGEEQLKIGKDTFAEKLKEENATITMLDSGMKAYMTTLKEVFQARIAGEKAVSEAMAKSGAKPKELLESQAAVLKAEKEYLVQRFGGWMDYYTALRSLHSKAVDAQKTKEKELAALQDSIAAQRRGHMDTMLGLIEKLMAVQGYQQNSEEIYLLKRNAAIATWEQAQQLSGEARIKALEQYKTQMSALTGEVIRYGVAGVDADGQIIAMNTQLLTQEEAIKAALVAVNAAQVAITEEQGKMTAAKQAEIDKEREWATQLQSAMTMAQNEMSKYKGLIDEASRAIEQMDREIAISVIDKATPAILAIKNQLDALQNKSITVTVNQVAGTTVEGGSGGSSFTGKYPITEGPWAPSGVGTQDWWGAGEWASGGAFDRGTVIPFARGGIINRPTIFPMARGYGLMGEAGPEAVMPLTRGRDGKLGVKASGGGQVIHIAAGAIVINGANKSSKELSREIVRDIRDEMRRLQSVGG